MNAFDTERINERAELLDLVKDYKVLEPLYIPDEIQGRTDKLEWIEQGLKFFDITGVSMNVLILGPPGSGKTVCIKHLLKKYDNSNGFRAAYIPTYSTSNSFLRQLSEKLGIDLGKRDMGSKVLLELFKKKFAETGKRLVVAIDEVDKLVADKSDMDILYELSRAEIPISILLITNVTNLLELILDERTRSSLALRVTAFPAYTASELRDILDYRVRLAFREGALDSGVIPLVVALTMNKERATQEGRRIGDARFALSLLHHSVNECYKSEGTTVSTEHVKSAYMELRVNYLLNRIGMGNAHEHMILYVVANKSGSSPSEVYHEYCELMESIIHKEPLQNTQYHKYLKQFEKQGIIKYDRRGLGRGRGQEWMIMLNEDLDSDIVGEAAKLAIESAEI